MSKRRLLTYLLVVSLLFEAISPLFPTPLEGVAYVAASASDPWASTYSNSHWRHHNRDGQQRAKVVLSEVHNDGDVIQLYDETYTITAQKEHYNDATQSITLDSTTNDVTVTFTMTPGQYTVVVEAYDTDGNPVDNFTLKVNGVDKGTFNTGDTLLLTHGTYTFTFEKPYWDSQDQTVMVDHDNTKVVFTNLHKQDVAYITFEFKDLYTGESIPSAEVRFAGNTTTLQSGEGILLHEGIEATFEVNATGYQPTNITLTVLSDTSLVVFLKPQNTSAGNVSFNVSVVSPLANYTKELSLDVDAKLREYFSSPLGIVAGLILVLGLTIGSLLYHRSTFVALAMLGIGISYIGAYASAPWALTYSLILMFLAYGLWRAFGGGRS